ncbi:MAG: GNAT family N-acetyltransferase [Deltaproteobacteria bacterium]|nr:GNAT family N-acetyltransferase [Deltaproteobacteria bacterium]
MSGLQEEERNPGDSQAAKIALRHAVISDGNFIGSLSGDVFKVYGPYEDILLRWFKSERDITTIIACRDKTQIGFVMLSEPSDMYNLHEVSEILGIAVKPQSQGKGVGGMLLRAIEIKSASLNIKWLFLHTAIDNVSARRLYERTGYTNLEIKKGFYPEGQDAIVMYKAVKRFIE